MAKRSAKGSERGAPPSDDSAASVTPVPEATLYVTFTELAKGEVLHRVDRKSVV